MVFIISGIALLLLAIFAAIAIFPALTMSLVSTSAALTGDATAIISALPTSAQQTAVMSFVYIFALALTGALWLTFGITHKRVCTIIPAVLLFVVFIASLFTVPISALSISTAVTTIGGVAMYIGSVYSDPTKKRVH